MSMMCGHTNHFHFLIGNFFPLYVYTIVLKHCQTKNVLPSVQIQCFVLPAIYLSTAFFTSNLVIEQVKILHSSVKSSSRYQLLMKKYYYKGNIKCNSVKTNINFKRFFHIGYYLHFKVCENIEKSRFFFMSLKIKHTRNCGNKV